MTRIPDPPAPPLRPQLLDPAPGAPAVIDSGWQPPVVATLDAGRGTLGWVLAGVTLLLVTWAGMAAVELAASAYARAPALGAAAMLALAAAAAMVGWGLWAEWRGFRSLARVDRLRRHLAGDRLAPARATASAWVAQVAPRLRDGAAAKAAVAAAADMAELRAALRHAVIVPLAEAAGQLGTRAALQAGGLVALCPHPALDGLIVGLRGLRLVREVAALYGLRPGTLATLALARRVAMTAAGTAGVDLLSQSLSDALLQRLPVLSHLAAAIPGATLAAVRLYRLARFSALACSPLDPKGGDL
ncbi:MAG: DUF697 domain-containing protein [Acetobacteraceae bacterium]|nr:DUF697 domain-containing protein [Acetobacteraceae bacterium]